jgi:hypothetical protein
VGKEDGGSPIPYFGLEICTGTVSNGNRRKKISILAGLIPPTMLPCTQTMLWELMPVCRYYGAN